MNNCNGSFNEKLVISATNYVRELMGIDESLWVFINEGNSFKSVNHSGLYDKEFLVIRYNRDFLRIASTDKIIKCAFHESFHVIQHIEILGRIQGIQSKIFTVKELKQLEYEFDDQNYEDSIFTWGLQLSKQQAEEFSEELYLRFINEKINLDEFISKYYDLYPNKE